jgi:hypothetical protein
LYQTGGGDPLLVGDEIQCAALVFFAPSSPIAEFIEQPLSSAEVKPVAILFLVVRNACRAFRFAQHSAR